MDEANRNTGIREIASVEVLPLDWQLNLNLSLAQRSAFEQFKKLFRRLTATFTDQRFNQFATHNVLHFVLVLLGQLLLRLCDRNFEKITDDSELGKKKTEQCVSSERASERRRRSATNDYEDK